MTELQPGELKIRRNGQESRLATGGGFAEVMPDRVSILTDMAVSEHEIDESAAQVAMDRAKAALADKSLDEEQMASVQSALLRSIAQLKVKRRRSHP